MFPNLPSSYTLEDGWFKHNYRASELERSVDDDFLYMTAVMKMPEENFEVEGVSLRFMCKYSLKDQSVKSTSSVSGGDANESRVGIGYLRYSLNLDSTNKVSSILKNVFKF